MEPPWYREASAIRLIVVDFSDEVIFCRIFFLLLVLQGDDGGHFVTLFYL